MMQDVTSTLIKSIGYDSTTERLSVVIRNDPQSVYNYDGVSRQTANQFVEANSKGRFFNSEIRGRFPTTKAAS